MRGVLYAAALPLLAACSFDGAVQADAEPVDGAELADANPQNCASPFVATALGCHAFPNATSLARLSWSAARAACQSLGGDLPVIDSAAESTYIATTALNPGDTRRVWLGLSGPGPAGGNWIWIDGETVSQKGLSLWVAGQPAGAGCAALRPESRWQGRICTNRMLVVCERPS